MTKEMRKAMEERLATIKKEIANLEAKETRTVEELRACTNLYIDKACVLCDMLKLDIDAMMEETSKEIHAIKTKEEQC